MEAANANDEIVASLRNREELQRQLAALNSQREGVDLSATSTQRLGAFTVAALILNRTIGTGIFAQPTNILELTGSSGVAIALWGAGGLLVTCVLLCWLELGMTVPIFNYVDEDGISMKVSTPRSGGDKNFLEYVYTKPKLLATCIFGIVFILFGHLAGNAIQFGIFMTTAMDPDCKEGDACFKKASVLGWAVMVVTLCALINVLTRQLAIGLNNFFAVAKVGLVATLALLGIIYGTIHGDGCRRITWEKHGDDGGTFGDIVLALVFASYPYGGFEQPFYVLAEVRDPRRTFPKATILAMVLAVVLFPLANVGYLCMTPYTGRDSLPQNMVVAMFEKVSGASSPSSDGDQDRAAVQAVAAILAVSAFANIMAQTYTGSRVKQEVGKEGILPYSLLFATGSSSILSKLRAPTARKDRPSVHSIDCHPEQVPIAATFLHWVFEVIMILAVGIPLEPTPAYRLLTSIKVFTVMGILCFFTVGGLLYLKVDSWTRGLRGKAWYANVKFLPWLDPLPVIIATLGLALLLFGSFAPPSVNLGNDMPYYVGPVAAWGITLASIGWWLWLKFDLRRNRQYLHVERKPFIEKDAEGGELVLKAELIVVERLPTRARAQVNLTDLY